MKIAYISECSPLDVQNWSGTPFYVFNTLSKNHTVVWIGENMTFGAYWHHKYLQRNKTFFIHDYCPEMGKILSDKIKFEKFDLIITSVYIMASDLDVDVPIIYFSDIIYFLCKGIYFPMTEEIEKRSIACESRALKNADRIIFSSEMVMKKAMDFYGLPKEKIHVIEFGANIPEPTNIVPEQYDKNICRLLFVGRDWERKGGDTILRIFDILREQGFSCELTIIGSEPKCDIKSQYITVIPFLDKGNEEDLKKYDTILRKCHFMVLPTRYDAYGILFCEASAYGIPSISADVGGVSQPIKNGVNGILLSSNSTAGDYAKLIKETFENESLYTNLRVNSRKEYETRLNWNIWGQKVNNIIEELVNEYNEKQQTKDINDNILSDLYVPVYAINLKSRPDRLENLKKQFLAKSEFNVTYVDAIKNKNGAIGLWQSICKAVRMAQQRGEDVIIICEDDHEFTDYYNKDYFFSNIVGAYNQGAELMNGGIGGFGTAVPVSSSRCWVDWFWCTQFVVIFSTLFPKIVTYEFGENDTADGVLSKLSNQSLVLYPPISKQKNYDYSDIKQHESQSEFQNGIFQIANKRLDLVTKVYRHYKVNSSLKIK